MSDIREALAHAILVNAMCPGQEYIATHVADAILAEFLVVPRSDISTEYGCRRSDEDLADLTETRDAAIQWALERRDWQRQAMNQLSAEAVERPSLPWSPIPLPEGGDSQ